MKPRKILKDMESFFEQEWSAGDLIEFHSRHKLSLMACSTDAFESLAQLISSAPNIDPESLQRAYQSQFREAIKTKPTVGRNVKALDQILADLKEKLTDSEKKELRNLIEQYRRGEIPLSKPQSMARKLAKKHQAAQLQQQSYLER